MSKNVLLIDETILRDRTSIHTNIDAKLLYPEIKAVQDMYIHPILGTALYNKIINDVNAGTITGVYKSLLDDYVIDTLIWYVMMQLPIPLTAQFWNRGVHVKHGEGDTALTLEQMQQVSDMYRMRAEWYANRLRLFLVEDNGVNYPEWDDDGNRVDDISPVRRTFTMPIWLGDCDCPPKGMQVYKDPTKCR